MGSGGAATGCQVLEFFEDIGIPVADGYGLTEVSIALCCAYICLIIKWYIYCFSTRLPPW